MKITYLGLPHLDNRNGNSIIMVIVGLGITALIALNLADLFAGAFKTNRAITQAVEAEQIASLVQMSLKKKDSCEQALLKDTAGNLIASRKVSEIKKSFSVSDFRIPQVSGGSVSLVKPLSASDCSKPQNAAACNGVVLSSITVSAKKDAAGTDISEISNSFLLGEIVLTFAKTGAVSGAQVITRTVPVGFDVDPVTKSLKSCQLGGDSVVVQEKSGQPKRRCSPSLYGDKPWVKERIYCSTRGGGVSVLYYAGDSLKGINSTITYTSPHGKDPLTIF